MNKEDYNRFLELEGLRSGGIDSGCSDEFQEHEEEYNKLEKQVLYALQCEEQLKKLIDSKDWKGCKNQDNYADFAIDSVEEIMEEKHDEIF